MRVVVVGLGTIGSAVKNLLEQRGHSVVSVGRKSGDHQADTSDPASLKKLFGRLSRLFHGLPARAGRGSSARLSARHLTPDHRAHSEAA